MSQVTELKKVLRGILIARKRHGIPLRHLESSYREMEGRNIPLCGYPDTAALLNSLNDTISTVRSIDCNSATRNQMLLKFDLDMDL